MEVLEAATASTAGMDVFLMVIPALGWFKCLLMKDADADDDGDVLGSSCGVAVDNVEGCGCRRLIVGENLCRDPLPRRNKSKVLACTRKKLGHSV